MGGDQGGTRAKVDKSAARWLQSTIDLLAGAYGWSKAEILELFPAEVSILVDIIRKRQAEENDAELFRLVVASRAPYTKDTGVELLNEIRARHAVVDHGDNVTAESIRKDLDRVRRRFAGKGVK